MKTIFTIFKNDCKAVFHNIWATIIVIGIMIIPALYAWFNIHSNWDPYSATQGIKIAVANSDDGAEIEGMNLNIGGMIVDQLAKNDAIGWQFMDENAAIAGVESGQYYAAVIIPKDFSENVGSIASLVIEKPEIIYYVNEKKNAIAPKITNTGVNTVQLQVNEAIIETASSVIGSISKDGLTSFQDVKVDAVDQVTSSLQELNDNLGQYKTLITAVNQASQSLEASLNSIRELLPDLNQVIAKAQDVNSKAEAMADDSKQNAQAIGSTISSAIETSNAMTQSLFDQTQAVLNLADEQGSKAADQIEDQLSEVMKIETSLKDHTETMIDSFSDIENAAGGRLNVLGDLISRLQDRKAKLEDLDSKLKGAISDLKADKDLSADVKTSIMDAVYAIHDGSNGMMDVYNNTVVPAIEQAYSTVDSVLSDTDSTLASAQNIDLNGSFDSLDSALNSSAQAMNTTLGLIENAQKKIQGYIDEIDQAAENEKLQKVEDLLNRDPQLVSAFLKEPVSIETKSVYPIANYGSGMAPFYTTLAIWVGALVNCAIMKTKVKRKEEDEPISPDQAYFGRYLFFAFVSIMQALIICLGDLYIMKIQCLHPFLFCFMGVIAAINFSLLMYTLTVSFGDVGKAIAVILMVIQVAGSGGTFPIDILPDLYQKLYPLFPFNYSINGMRECIGGIYQNAYWMDVVFECCFIPVSLFIGLALRKPIMKMKNYIEERVERTGFIG